MGEPLYRKIAREAIMFEFYASYIFGRLEYYHMPQNMKQRVADLTLLEIILIQSQGGIACLSQ